MGIIIALTIAYIYTDFLYLYFYCKVLGRKYSLKITILGIMGKCIFDCIVKLYPQIFVGIGNSGILNILMIASTMVYALCFFGSSIIKRLLAVFAYMTVQAGMDAIGLKMTTMITGRYEMFQMDSKFTYITVLCSCTMITLGTCMFVWIWKAIEQKQFKLEKYQWLCLLLPFSQYAMLQQTAVRYALEANPIPVIVILGLFLGLLADIYMFILFDRLNKKNRVEEALRQLQHQYELEQLRYDHLKEMQQEVNKLRHDFQNYILMMKKLD